MILDLLPDPMREPTVLAIPFFVTLIAFEGFAAWRLQKHANEEQVQPASGAGSDMPARLAPGAEPDMPARFAPGAYARRDSVASISMGLVSIATSAAWKVLGLLVYAAIFAYLAPWHLPANAWYTWVIAFIAVDFLFYWNHRASHRIRVIWATHQAHHSSEYFNFTTALRQKWNISAALVVWLPLPLLGIPPALVLAAYSLNLVYQFWIHTERIGTLWRPIEFVFNTPSHHRVHHGNDQEYLDRNYAGTFILWDRMFGTFTAEKHRPTYGLTTQVNTYNIVTLQTHEYAAIARDVRRASGWRTKVGYILGPPGWSPAAPKQTEPANSAS